MASNDSEIKQEIKEYIFCCLDSVYINGNKINIGDEYVNIDYDDENEVLKVIDYAGNTAKWTLDELVSRLLDLIDGEDWDKIPFDKKKEYIESIFYYNDEY